MSPELAVQSGDKRSDRSERRGPGPRGALAALLLAAAVLVSACADRPLPAGDAAQLTMAMVVEGQNAEQAVTLPDAWEVTAPARDGRVRYRLELPDAALRSEQSVLFIPRVGNSVRLQINGEPLLALGDLGEDGGRTMGDTSRVPLWVPLPPSVLLRSGNRLEIEVIGQPHRDAGLSAVWVGPLVDLEPMYRARLNHELRGVWVVSAAATVMGVLVLLLAWRAWRFAYACFGAGSLLWAWRVAGPPDGGAVWGPIAMVLFHAAAAWFVILMSLYALAAVGRDTSVVRRVLGAWAVAALALSVGIVMLNAPALRNLLIGGSGLVGLVLLAMLAREAWRGRSSPPVLLGVATVFSLVVAGRDVFVFRVVHDYGALAWSRYTILLLLLVLAWLLVDEFARSGAALRSLNAELQDRVALKEKELREAFALTGQREREQAVLGERDRILREMHDGLGGRLVAALALTAQIGRQAQPPGGSGDTEGRAIEEPLRELKLTLEDCLIELRLALDSLEADRRPLIEALAELRFRIEPSLRAAGIRLVWQVAETAGEASLAATDTLHVLRIVREALTNVIKHAQATVVWLRLAPRDDGGLTLEVVDNGLLQRGDVEQTPLPLFVPASIAQGGRGLANMQRRAAALGAVLSSGPAAEGWSVTLALPAVAAAP